ncbi:hypothetical protein Aduo_000935 [Ancylostoma duodenale]
MRCGAGAEVKRRAGRKKRPDSRPGPDASPSWLLVVESPGVYPKTDRQGEAISAQERSSCCGEALLDFLMGLNPLECAEVSFGTNGCRKSCRRESSALPVFIYDKVIFTSIGIEIFPSS